MSSNYSGPRMGMNQMNGNNRRSVNLSRLPLNEKPVPHAQLEEVIKYMQDSWNKVVLAPETDRSRPMPVYYSHEADNPKAIPKDIDSIDMEDVWEMRVMGEQNQNLTTQPQQQHHHS